MHRIFNNKCVFILEYTDREILQCHVLFSVHKHIQNIVENVSSFSEKSYIQHTTSLEYVSTAQLPITLQNWSLPTPDTDIVLPP